MRTWRAWVLLIPVLPVLAVGASGCSEERAERGDAPAPPAAGRPAETPAAPVAAGGTIEAVVRYDGAPQIETTAVNKDVEQCGTEARLVRVGVGDEGGLQDAVVALLGQVGAAAAPRRARPVLDQEKCEFRPHVLAMTPGELDIVNSDGILHNIHTFSSDNPPINKAQPKFRKVMTERFGVPERIRVQCDVHSWMEAWIVVVSNPWHGVTDRSGRARLESVPPGRHRVEVWHPVVGRQTQEVEVVEGQTVRLSFALAG